MAPSVLLLRPNLNVRITRKANIQLVLAGRSADDPNL